MGQLTVLIRDGDFDNLDDTTSKAICQRLSESSDTFTQERDHYFGFNSAKCDLNMYTTQSSFTVKRNNEYSCPINEPSKFSILSTAYHMG